MPSHGTANRPTMKWIKLIYFDENRLKKVISTIENNLMISLLPCFRVFIAVRNYIQASLGDRKE